MRKLFVAAAAVMMLAACGPAPPAQPASGVIIDLVIKDGKVEPQDKRVEVKVGQPVVLNVSSDEADELHVHSEPEHEFGVLVTADQRFEFIVEVPGQVSVESHHLGTTIVKLVVRP